jgi:hypothetical protein
MLKNLIGSWKLGIIAKSRYAVSFTNLISVNLLQLFKKEMVGIIKFDRGTAPGTRLYPFQCNFLSLI